MSSLKERIHHAVFEDSPEEQKATPVPAPTVHASIPSSYRPEPQYPSSITTPMPAGSQDDLYEKLKKNTSFEFATSIQHLIELQKPLETIIPDPTTRLKAAYAQAKAQKSLSDGDIDHDLTKLTNLLTQESDKFQAMLQHEKEGIVNDETHATQLEQQLHDLRVAISDRKTKVDRADTGFSSALSRRKNDLAELTNQFTVLK
jgi:hypothetical protein